MLYETDIADLIHFAKLWSNLGEAVSEQVEQIVDDPKGAAGLREGRADLEVNPYAIQKAQEALGGLNIDLENAFSHYFELMEQKEG